VNTNRLATKNNALTSSFNRNQTTNEQPRRCSAGRWLHPASLENVLNVCQPTSCFHLVTVSTVNKHTPHHTFSHYGLQTTNTASHTVNTDDKVNCHHTTRFHITAYKLQTQLVTPSTLTTSFIVCKTIPWCNTAGDIYTSQNDKFSLSRLLGRNHFIPLTLKWRLTGH